MPIEKLTEFAKDGQKNTDELNLEVGFVVNRKPARQWFNYLFNMLSLKINELINLDPIARVEIINDLTTNDEKKPLSAAMGKKLQDEKIAISDLVNDLVTGGSKKPLTAEQGKLLFAMFTGGNNHFRIPNPSKPNEPWIVQWGSITTSVTANTAKPFSATFQFAFPNVCSFVMAKNQNYVGGDATTEGGITNTGFNGMCVSPSSGLFGISYLAIGR